MIASTWGFFAATIVTGIGFGGANQPALRLIIAAAPQEARSGVLSSVYVVSYLAFGVPSVLAGFATPVIGFTLTVAVYVSLVAILASVALALQAPSRHAGVAAQGTDPRHDDARAGAPSTPEAARVSEASAPSTLFDAGAMDVRRVRGTGIG